MDPFIGQVMLVGFNFAPRGWAFCHGQLLSIGQNSALFSLLGTIYGGNGQTTFALPDLRSRVPVGMGQGSGLTNITQGEVSGSESVTLLAGNLPAHTHTLNVHNGAGTASVPVAGVALAQSVVDDGTPIRSYSSAAPNTTLAATSIGNSAGGSQAVGIRNPYVGMNFIIALQGVFPSRS
jgi:microcystin-dependent protein